MPSPFPGMDPYLEHPDVFPDLHDRLITHLSELLQSTLPPPYYAALGRRVWIEVSRRFIGPDVNVLRPRAESSRADGAGSVAVAPAAASRLKVVRVPHDERREPFVEVFAGQGGSKRLVTTIEILSPTNKTPGDQGRDLYLRKQREVLSSKTHIVEIDLLRSGEHTTAVPRKLAIEVCGAFDYHVCVHRFDNVEDYFVYPISLEEPLPEISVPLLPGDPDVPVPLQALFNLCYDAGPYRREIDYEKDSPVPPLAAEKAGWATQAIRAARAG
ncbi:MAG: DUF4058 family protein [Planctomycetes bacterium]|nr:DUF4058 family protein [Planctomycetota bacterium]